MQPQRRIALAFVACLAYGSLQAQPQVQVLERETIAGNELPRSLRLPLTVLQLEGSGWTKERAIGAVRDAASILAQCGVTIPTVEWIRLAAPGHLDFFTPLSRELARAHPVGRPALYLVRDTRNRPAFEAEAIGRGNSRTRPELADTVWMIAAVRDPGVALAHELAHVLMNNGEHSHDPGNLMQEDTTATGTRLSAAQCALLHEQGTAHGLLQR